MKDHLEQVHNTKSPTAIQLWLVITLCHHRNKLHF